MRPTGAAAVRIDIVRIARRIPVAVLGDAVGVGDLSEAVGALCDSGAVADTLPPVVVTSLLFPCRDATAALVPTALADGVPPEQAASVVLTRRARDRWVLLSGVSFGAGAHASPGQEHALEIAHGFVRAFADQVVINRGPYEPRGNIQMPAWLPMRQR